MDGTFACVRSAFRRILKHARMEDLTLKSNNFFHFTWKLPNLEQKQNQESHQIFVSPFSTCALSFASVLLPYHDNLLNVEHFWKSKKSFGFEKKRRQVYARKKCPRIWFTKDEIANNIENRNSFLSSLSSSFYFCGNSSDDVKVLITVPKVFYKHNVKWMKAKKENGKYVVHRSSSEYRTIVTHSTLMSRLIYAHVSLFPSFDR